MTEASQEFQKTGKRILRRSVIARNLEEEGGVGVVRKEVRETSTRHQELMQNLSEQLVNPDPRYLRLTEYFYKELSDKFPELVACGLTGSGALGGGLMRHETDIEEFADYDGFIIVKPGTSIETVNRIHQQAVVLMNKLVDERDPLVSDFPEDFHFCGMLDYHSYFLSDLRELSDERIDSYFGMKLRNSNSEAAKLLSYFMPTYPPEIGEENRARLFGFFEKMPIGLWKEYAQELKDIWRERVTTVKSKHVLEPKTEKWDWETMRRNTPELPIGRTAASLRRDIRLSGEISTMAPIVSHGLFSKLLDSIREV